MNKLQINVFMSDDANGVERAEILGAIREVMSRGALNLEMSCDSPNQTTFKAKGWSRMEADSLPLITICGPTASGKGILEGIITDALAASGLSYQSKQSIVGEHIQLTDHPRVAMSRSEIVGRDKVETVNQLDATPVAPRDPVELIALAVIGSTYASSEAIDKANAILLAAMSPALTLDTTCEASQ